ncbi:MAG: isoprenylcysteine carboxylmethyltransferase family protein [Pseudomonadota bacterium]
MNKRHLDRSVVMLAVFSYALTLVVILLLVGFLLDLEQFPFQLNGTETSGLASAIAINSFVVIAFCVSHSWLARTRTKERLSSIVPAVAERSLYVLVSSLSTLALMVSWQPITAQIWSVESEILQLAIRSSFVLSVLFLFWTTFEHGHLEFFGIQRVLDRIRNKRSKVKPIASTGIYGWVRHPMYVGWMLVFWITPTMTGGHLLLAVTMTAYIKVAVRFEEQDLISRTAGRYADYINEVPSVWPRHRE